jgi:mannose-6-phosphate isomerase-like protein (cupin superfamily)
MNQFNGNGGADFGANPFVVNLDKAVSNNNTFRTALWTGNHLQLTLMCIPAGEDIGVEMHPDVDQFLRIEEGEALVQTGSSEDNLNARQPAYDGYAIFIPAGTWHNIVNMGSEPLKLYSIYAPPNHPHGTVHLTKAEAEAAE